MPNGDDREWVRFCSAVEGFRALYGVWPTRIRLMPDCLAVIRDAILTPESFAVVAGKVELVPDENATYVAEDDAGRRFDYAEGDAAERPDVPAEDWFGRPQHRHDDADPLAGHKFRDADGNLVYPQIAPHRVRYIKLGRKGGWEKECVENGTIIFGYDTSSPQRLPLCLAGRWSELTETFLPEVKKPGTATQIVNQARQFFEDDGSTLWITFYQDRMYWGFLEPAPATPHASDRGVLRRVKGGWRSEDLNGEPLTKERLSGALTKLAAYRGVSCDVNVADYAVRRINGRKIPEVQQAVAALEEMRKSVLAMMRLLGPKDFEILVDLVFSISGWRRQGVIGKTQKTLDLDLLLPSTGERAFVQVKSATNSKELAAYVRQFERLGVFDRMFFVYHSGEAKTRDKRVIVIGPEKLSEMAIDAGLVNWLIRKVS